MKNGNCHALKTFRKIQFKSINLRLILPKFKPLFKCECGKKKFIIL